MKKSILSIFATIALLVSCSDDDSLGGDTTKFELVVNDFKGEINEGTITLDAAETYKLTGALTVKNGATLTIPAGTVIEAAGGTSAYIAVAQGGKINVNGTAANPVVMTSASATPAPGDWGGLVICGKAKTNKGGSNGETASAEVSNLTYGGSDNSDNSGTIKYLRLEYTGAEFTADKQFNGLSLFAVGSGTTIEYVQSYKGKDDGIEFFGGAVQGKYLVSTESGDDGIDFADGWSGTGKYWYIIDAAKAGIEGSNNGEDGAAKPETTATLNNTSVVNSGTSKDEGALYMKEGAGTWTVSNVYVKGGVSGFFLKSSDNVAVKHITDGDHNITSIQFDGIDGDKVNGTDNTSFFTEGDNTGAGNGAALPQWATGWTK